MHGPIESQSWKLALFLLLAVVGCTNSANKSIQLDSSLNDATSRVTPTGEVAGLIIEDYQIHREPKYASVPQYCLFSFGDPAQQLIWLVLDGDSIYVDRNGNGDLTDDGEPLEPINERVLNSNYRDGDYEPIELVSGKELVLGYYQTSEDPIKQTVKLALDDTAQQYAGWKPIFSPSPLESKVFQFGGKYTPRALRKKQIKLSGTEEKLNVAFVINGPGKDARTSLSIHCVPADVFPVLEVEWPTNGSGPLRSQVKLTERC